MNLNDESFEPDDEMEPVIQNYRTDQAQVTDVTERKSSLLIVEANMTGTQRMNTYNDVVVLISR